jgi:APA family basic amino acid/polyamine antiporter
VILLRRSQPDLVRPYKMWGYPVTPVFFVAVATYFIVNTAISRPGPSLAALGLIATGVPVYFLWRKR